MLIRQMLSSDISAIFTIEQTAQISPWSAKMFEDSLIYGDVGWVLLDENEVRGYVLVKPIPGQSEADILTIAVDKNTQRRGYGQALVTWVLTQFDCLCLEVRVSNKAAIALYEKLGFKKIGIRVNYYQHEDAVMMSINVVRQYTPRESFCGF